MPATSSKSHCLQVVVSSVRHSAMTLVLLDAYGYIETAKVLPSMIIGVLSSLTEEWRHSEPDFPVLASHLFSAVSLMHV